ncbi:MAG: DUF1015 domain-containing protein [Gammaproteobacteria bacterium]|nr:DUF1015 domain-containing protein [Gammaproteobacteria bacterium]
MPLIKPFPGLRPAPGRAADVAAPPYDVMNASEARLMVQGRPWSFLHISRPEVDLAEGIDPYAPEVYAKAAENMQRMREQRILLQDGSDCFYLYRLTMGEHVQTGIVAAASVAAYDRNRIRKHEFTRPSKEDDRVRQIEALAAQTGPVFLVYRSQADVDTRMDKLTERKPEIDITAADGVRHQLWVVDDGEDIAQLMRSFDAMPALYVADGHHRSAAASRVAAARGSGVTPLSAEAPHDYFLAVIFPHDQVQILDYNRVVRDLNGLDREQLLKRVGARFSIVPSATPVKPVRHGEFGMYLPGQWYRLQVEESRIPLEDPVQRLDVSILANELLRPILGITDQRTDERIDFVGGIRGLPGLQARVDSGEMAVAFAVRPTDMEALMAVADAGEVMPPKSTWFEPKLADGLVSHLL